MNSNTDRKIHYIESKDLSQNDLNSLVDAFKNNKEPRLKTLELMKESWTSFLDENEKFTSKNIKASASRARKSLGELSKLIKLRRKEIMDEKAALATK